MAESSSSERRYCKRTVQRIDRNRIISNYDLYFRMDINYDKLIECTVRIAPENCGNAEGFIGIDLSLAALLILRAYL